MDGAIDGLVDRSQRFRVRGVGQIDLVQDHPRLDTLVATGGEDPVEESSIQWWLCQGYHDPEAVEPGKITNELGAEGIRREIPGRVMHLIRSDVRVLTIELDTV